MTGSPGSGSFGRGSSRAKTGSHASVVMAVVAITVAGGEQLESSGVWGRGGNDGARGDEND